MKGYPIKMGDVRTRYFLIGDMANPKNYDESQGHHGRWCVQPINIWAASLGSSLTPDNAIPYHLTIVLHELTHIMAEQSCCHITWDEFLFKVINS